jgi:hypothetical protein
LAELKTTVNDGDVNTFLESVADEQRRGDAKAVCRLMEEVTQQSPKMWGTSIVGFGSYHYKYASGREGDYLAVGFSPRKQNMTLYLMDGIDRYEELLAKLGKHSTGKSCLYIKRLADVDVDVLRDLVKASCAAS